MSRSIGRAEQLLGRLEWTVLRRLDGLLQGDYRTLFRGFGLDLAELREYQPGDDVRSIDWNVTARMNEPYVRQYNEDRELSAWFLLDVSPSMDFGSNGVEKRELLVEFVGLLSRLLTRHGNRVGAILYSGRVERIIPPRSGRRHVLYLLHCLLEQGELPSSPETNLTVLLSTALKFIRRRSLLFIVSDFVSLPGWERALGNLARRNEVLAVRLFDPVERELPDAGIIMMRDAETGESIYVDTHSWSFRRRFQRAAFEREQRVGAALSKVGVDLLELSTDTSLLDSVVRFAERRRQQKSVLEGRHDLSLG